MYAQERNSHPSSHRSNSPSNDIEERQLNTDLGLSESPAESPEVENSRFEQVTEADNEVPILTEEMRGLTKFRAITTGVLSAVCFSAAILDFSIGKSGLGAIMLGLSAANALLCRIHIKELSE